MQTLKLCTNLFLETFKRNIFIRVENVPFLLFMVGCMLFLNLSPFHMIMAFVIVPCLMEIIILLYVGYDRYTEIRRLLMTKAYILTYITTLMGKLVGNTVKFFICFGLCHFILEWFVK